MSLSSFTPRLLSSLAAPPPATTTAAAGEEDTSSPTANNNNNNNNSIIIPRNESLLPPEQRSSETNRTTTGTITPAASLFPPLVLGSTTATTTASTSTRPTRTTTTTTGSTVPTTLRTSLIRCSGGSTISTANSSLCSDRDKHNANMKTHGDDGAATATATAAASHNHHIEQHHHRSNSNHGSSSFEGEQVQLQLNDIDHGNGNDGAGGDVDNDDGGSSLAGAIFNFTNCIVGAGAIGLGGAIAQSGGLISVASIILFGILTKQSLDLVILLSLETGHATYEDLGYLAFGTAGKLLIAASKFLYSFGCVVAYVVVVKDNLAPALLNLLQHQCHSSASSSSLDMTMNHNFSTDATVPGVEGDQFQVAMMDTVCHILEDRMATTWLACLGIILPLCLLRDMRPLACFSLLSIASILAIVVIILYLYVANPDDAIQQNYDDNGQHATFYETWLEIRPAGYIECLGTFVFTFVSQHTVHLVFNSLKAELRTTRHWNIVSLCSITIASVVSLTIGVGVYISFGQHAQSDIFEIYPQIPLIDVAKLMLAVTMILTFPLPFFSCREILITTLFCPSPAALTTNAVGEEEEEEEQHHHHHGHASNNNDDNNNEQRPSCRNQQSSILTTTTGGTTEDGAVSDLEEPLLSRSNSGSAASSGFFSTEDTMMASRTTVEALSSSARSALLLDNDPTQLKWIPHVALTVKLWLIVVCLALAAPSLGDVLDLVGCASGTMICFIIPSAISFQLRGYSLQATVLLTVGGMVGIVGTYFSIRQILQDIGL